MTEAAPLKAATAALAAENDDCPASDSLTAPRQNASTTSSSSSSEAPSETPPPRPIPKPPSDITTPSLLTHQVFNCPVASSAVIVTNASTQTILAATPQAEQLLLHSSLPADQFPGTKAPLIGQAWTSLVEISSCFGTLQDMTPLQQGGCGRVQLLRVRTSADHIHVRVHLDDEDEDHEHRYIQACSHAIENAPIPSHPTPDGPLPDGIVWFIQDISDVRDLLKAVNTDHSETAVEVAATAIASHAHTSIECDASTPLLAATASSSHYSAGPEPPSTHQPQQPDLIVLKINSFGRIVQSYPLTSFLGHPSQLLLDKFIMRMVDSQDAGELCRGLSRASRPLGYAAFMVRWTWQGVFEELNGEASSSPIEEEWETKDTSSGQESTPEPDLEAQSAMEVDDALEDESTPLSPASIPSEDPAVTAYLNSRRRRHSIFDTSRAPIPQPPSDTATPPTSTQPSPSIRPLQNPTPPPESHPPPLIPPARTLTPPIPAHSVSVSVDMDMDMDESDTSTPLPSNSPDDDPNTTWVHFTVGPCPSSTAFSPTSEDPPSFPVGGEPRDLLCLIQVVHPAAPSSSSARQPLPHASPAATFDPPQTTMTLTIHSSATLTGSVKKFAHAAGQVVQLCVWVLWRFALLPKTVMGRVGSVVLRYT